MPDKNDAMLKLKDFTDRNRLADISAETVI